MILPDSYQAALFLMILSMLCWGSWANTLKMCPGFRFQLFYWDYALGLAAAAVLVGPHCGIPRPLRPHILYRSAERPAWPHPLRVRRRSRLQHCKPALGRRHRRRRPPWPSLSASVWHSSLARFQAIFSAPPPTPSSFLAGSPSSSSPLSSTQPPIENVNPGPTRTALRPCGLIPMRKPPQRAASSSV